MKEILELSGALATSEFSAALRSACACVCRSGGTGGVGGSGNGGSV